MGQQMPNCNRGIGMSRIDDLEIEIGADRRIKIDMACLNEHHDCRGRHSFRHGSEMKHRIYCDLSMVRNIGNALVRGILGSLTRR